MAEDRRARARELAGLSVGQAARILGVKPAELRAVELGQVTSSALTSERLADVYGCSVAWLTGAVPRHDFSAINSILGGRELYSRDREAIAELLASLPRRTC